MDGSFDLAKSILAPAVYPEPKPDNKIWKHIHS